MEIESTLPALLAFAISALAFAVGELGAATIAAGMRARAANVLNGSADRFASLESVANLPAGPTAPFRLVSRLALAVAMISVVAVAWSARGDLRWEIVSAGAAGALLFLGVLSYVTRALGMRFAARICPFASRIAWLLSFPLRPVLFVEARIVGCPPSESQTPSAPLIVDSPDQTLDEHEVRMIRGVVELDRTVAREVMTPRVDIVAVESDASLKTLVNVMNSEGHSRVPIYDGDLDHIVGVAHARDALKQLAESGDASRMRARQVSRRPLFIPESKTLEGLLEVFQKERMHLAVVADEYGGVSGIVTIEDLLEEIVGEIQDEFDTEEPDLKQTGAAEFTVDGGMPLDEFNDSLGVNVVGDGFDTVGGLVFARLGKIPVAGDRVEHDGLSIEVLDTSGRRPTTLRVTLAPTVESNR